MTMTGALKWGRTLARYAVLTFLLLVVLLPILGITLSAFKTHAEVIRGPFALPETWRLDNFVNAWTAGRFSAYFRSSVIVVVPVVVVSVFLSTLTGYAFGTLLFPGQKLLFAAMLIGFMIPFEAVVIPLYHMLRRMGLTDSYWALILPQIGLSVSFGTFWMASFFRNAPQELIDAATIDGASRWQALWQVLWPLARPAVLTLVVLLFMWTWNEFLLALVLVQSESVRTLPVGLAFFQGRFTADIPRLAAGSLIVAGPILVVYVFFQRHFIRGMLGGSLKG
jgi:raffinose/stachyose/melibiose transport system permease protein